MRWVSEEQKRLLSEWDEDALGYGRRLPETLAAPVWRNALVPEDVVRWAADMLRWVIADAEGGVQEVIDMLSPDLAEDERAALVRRAPEPRARRAPAAVGVLRALHPGRPAARRDRLRGHAAARPRGPPARHRPPLRPRPARLDPDDGHARGPGHVRAHGAAGGAGAAARGDPVRRPPVLHRPLPPAAQRRLLPAGARGHHGDRRGDRAPAGHRGQARRRRRHRVLPRGRPRRRLRRRPRRGRGRAGDTRRRLRGRRCAGRRRRT